VVHATTWCVLQDPVAPPFLVFPHTQVKLLSLLGMLPHVQAVAGLLLGCSCTGSHSQLGGGGVQHLHHSNTNKRRGQLCCSQ
jgi:hypothetical protein